MFSKFATVVAAVAVAVVATHSVAKADFTVCNQTTYGPVMVATAYDYQSGSDEWSRSEGFYYIPQGDCKTTLDTLTGDEQLYLFAWASSNESIFWDGTSNFSSGAREFCVDGHSSAFVYKADAAEPPCSAGVVRTFRYAGSADSTGDFTYNLEN